MVDLSGGPDGPIEHGFSNTVFIVPGVIILSLADDDVEKLERIVNTVQQESDATVMNEPPTLQEILKAIDSMTGFTLEEKEALKRDLVYTDAPGSTQGPVTVQVFSYEILLLFVLVLFILFFGYKLVKSLQDKERKRDEKRKAKQQKKKK